jgi:hypothetical protein
MADSVDERDFFVNLPIHMDAKKTLKYVVLTVILANFVLIAIVLLGTKTPPREPMPNPNGYDDFVRAAQMLRGDALRYYLTNSQEALADFVLKNEEALKLARLGLTRECRAPNDYSPDYAKKLTRELPPFRELSYALCAEGKLAEMQGRTNDAIKSYLDCTKFGESFSKGGAMVVKLVGIASENAPRRPLKSLVQSLGAQQCREIALKLEAINTDEAPVERNLKEDRAWDRAALSWRERMEGLLEYKQTRQERNDFIGHFQTNRLQRIQLTVGSAKRAYELEKGKKPHNVADLVPEYLKSIPFDPFTGTNIAYPIR